MPYTHKEYLNYEDIFLIQNKISIVKSRSNCDTSQKLGNKTFALPIVPSNMKSLVDEETCLFLAENGLFYVMHRFGTDVVKFNDFIKKQHNQFLSISMGINDDARSLIKLLKDNKINPEYITLDVANAWSLYSKDVIKEIKENFSSFLIAGNFSATAAAFDLYDWGADALKFSIGSGRACITKNKTGFYTPMVSMLEELSSALEVNKINMPIIADGGIREHGDIAKSLAVGSHFVMAGSLFAGYEQSAGQIIEIDGKKYKEYYGNASEFAKGFKKNVEGKKILEPFKGDMTNLLAELKEDLQSSISYAGGKCLKDLYGCEYGVIH